MDNYIAEIIKEYLTKRYPEETEGKIRSWLVEEENAEDKNEALAAYWELLQVDPDIFVYESLEQVKQRINFQLHSRVEEVEERVSLPIVSQEENIVVEETDTVPSVIMLSPADVVEVPEYETPSTQSTQRRPIKDNIESPPKSESVRPVVIHLKEPDVVQPIQENQIPEKAVEVKKETIFFANEPETEEKERNTFYWGKIVAVLIPFLFILMGAWFYMNQRTPAETIVNLSIPYGEKKQIELPDGSTVWLNAGSTISYPDEFRGAQRRVELSGEAFFSVAKDAKKPFKVETASFTVEVLGTEFNVMSYPDDDRASTTLTSGKIKVETVIKETYELAPSQQLSYDINTSETMIRTVNPETEADWKNGEIVFKDAFLKDILKTLERQFNVHFKTDDSLWAGDDTYTVKFINRETLGDMLNILQEMIDFSWKEEDNIIYLNKK